MLCTDRLERGETLVLYTDGVSEAMDGRRRHLGVGGLDRILAAAPTDAPPRAMIEHIRRGIEVHARGAAPQDDRCLLLVRRECV